MACDDDGGDEDEDEDEDDDDDDDDDNDDGCPVSMLSCKIFIVESS